MYAPERHQQILATARADGRVDVNRLAEDLDVTPETIRRDLTVLERHGLVRRVHGGAIPVERLGFEPGVADREGRFAGEKERIAKAALDELPDGGAVILDAGTTTVRLAELLPVGPRAHRRHPRAARRDGAGDAAERHAAPGRRHGARPDARRRRHVGASASSPTSTPTSRSSAPTG